MGIPDPTICSPLQVKPRNKLAKIGLSIRVGTVDSNCKWPTRAAVTRRAERFVRGDEGLRWLGYYSLAIRQ